MSEQKKLELQIDRYIVERSAALKIGVDVPKHELAILRRVHGDPKNVRLVEEDVDLKEFNFSANEEFDRLHRTYHRINSPNPVDQVFPRGALDLLAFGFVILEETVDNPEAERVINPREAAHKAKKKAAKAGK